MRVKYLKEDTFLFLMLMRKERPQVDASSPAYEKRFAAHLVISLRAAGLVTEADEELQRCCDQLVALYVAHLVDKGFVLLVARYVAHLLDRALRVSTYVRFMVGVRDADDRRACVELAHECFPQDAALITRQAVESIRQPTAAAAAGIGGGAAAGAGAVGVLPALTWTSVTPSKSQAADLMVEEEDTPDQTKISAIQWLCIRCPLPFYFHLFFSFPSFT